jgi:hypothetical protein
VLDEWIKQVSDELGIEPGLDFEPQLDLARVVAHKVERRGAPITAFLVGLAAGRAGGEPPQVHEATTKVMGLARRWRSPDE